MINYSFIIPHHNIPHLLNRLIASIPQRDDIEIIVVDDNSDEDKKPLINRPDVQVCFISEEESKGAGYARNVGLDIAKGKWLLFADSDDYYFDGFINELDKYKSTNYDIVFFEAYIESHNKINNDAQNNYIDFVYNQYEKSSKTELDFRRLTMTINVPWNKMFNRHFIIEINCRFETVPVGNDAWFSKYSGSKAKSVAIIRKKLYFYKFYPNNTTNRRRPKSDYYLIIDSNIRRNILYKEYGLLYLGIFPGFNVKNVKRDFGRKSCVMLILYALLHDPTIYSMFIQKIISRIKLRYEARIFNNCP